MFDTIECAYHKLGHKKEKAMDVALKRKYSNITREVINEYLNLCEPCTLKKKAKGKGFVVKPMAMSELNSRCQVNINFVDLIDMQSERYGDYKFILNYKDHLTKFVVLLPLKTKKAHEVADIILDIFCLLGAPNILHSDNGPGNIDMEEHIEEYLSNLTQDSDVTDTENVDEANTCENNNQQISSPMESEENVRVSIVCDQQFEEEISCFECTEYFHSTCTSAPQSEIPLCHLCAKKSVIETSCKHCKCGLQEQAEKMLQTSG
ncbi:hypothetical protein PR048_023353 [Dryococelus australis]|uniref:Integrase catalytic domain-containing protein n=1 Tax=Dryococelus australis TaxID=614101 RepID=A0ABQ9GTU8_9NEOP|nr:hypothetical protein PR048_023353 [Dryococelus australis]